MVFGLRGWEPLSGKGPEVALRGSLISVTNYFAFHGKKPPIVRKLRIEDLQGFLHTSDPRTSL